MSQVSVRYIVHDVPAAIAFYRDRLGFELDMHPAPPFAMMSRGGLRLLLSQPGAGGGGAKQADGTLPVAGGWNRFQIEVPNLEGFVAELRASGCRFRGDLVKGIGGNQILLEDPSGNLVELFEPAPRG